MNKSGARSFYKFRGVEPGSEVMESLTADAPSYAEKARRRRAESTASGAYQKIIAEFASAGLRAPVANRLSTEESAWANLTLAISKVLQAT